MVKRTCNFSGPYTMPMDIYVWLTVYLCTLSSYWTMAAVKDMVTIFVHQLDSHQQEQCNIELELGGKQANYHPVAS